MTPTIKQIRSKFHLRIIDAAKELSISQTQLKKACRMCHISRWPYRKCRSVKNIIEMLKLDLAIAESQWEKENIQLEIKDYNDKLEMIIFDPDINFRGRIADKSVLQKFSKKYIRTQSEPPHKMQKINNDVSVSICDLSPSHDYDSDELQIDESDNAGESQIPKLPIKLRMKRCYPN